MNYLDKLHDARMREAQDYLRDSHEEEADHVGKVVEVYYNTHRGMLSVRDAKTKKVFAHARIIALENASFVVQPAGRDRVRRENKKNVHAWVRGTVMPYWKAVGYDSWGAYVSSGARPLWDGTRVTYNPYKYDGFVEEVSEKPVSKVHLALVYANGYISTKKGGE